MERIKAKVEELKAKISATQRSQPAVTFGAMLHDSDYDEENDQRGSKMWVGLSQRVGANVERSTGKRG